MERLVLEFGLRPRCLVRSYGRVARIARFPVELARGDLLDRQSLEAALEGCDAVVNCAFGNGSEDAVNIRINTDGTRNLGAAALAKGVRKLVHLSTVEVYGADRPSVVTEDTTFGAAENSYGDSKREGEEICLGFAREQGLATIVLRPAVVYGPHAPVWTLSVADRLENRAIVLSDEFEGICNPVYVDDVAEAVFLAIERDAAAGEAFNIASGERITWNDYFVRMNEILGLPPLPRRGRGSLRGYGALRRVLKPALDLVRDRYGVRAFALYNRLRDSDRMPNLKRWMQRGALLEEAFVFGSGAYYDISKARRVLGFEPRFDLERGLGIVLSWLRHIGRAG